MDREHRPSLLELEMHGDFLQRHIGSRETEIAEMLKDLNLSSLDQLIKETVPKAIMMDKPLDLPAVRKRASNDNLSSSHEASKQGICFNDWLRLLRDSDAYGD